MAKITTEDLNTAIEWLGINKGDNGEVEACERVADMLKAQIAKRNKESIIRQVMKEKPGISRKVVTRAMDLMKGEK